MHTVTRAGNNDLPRRAGHSPHAARLYRLWVNKARLDHRVAGGDNDISKRTYTPMFWRHSGLLREEEEPPYYTPYPLTCRRHGMPPTTRTHTCACRHTLRSLHSPNARWRIAGELCCGRQTGGIVPSVFIMKEGGERHLQYLQHVGE